jgi:hypothetical protein
MGCPKLSEVFRTSFWSFVGTSVSYYKNPLNTDISKQKEQAGSLTACMTSIHQAPSPDFGQGTSYHKLFHCLPPSLQVNSWGSTLNHCMSISSLVLSSSPYTITSLHSLKVLAWNHGIMYLHWENCNCRNFRSIGIYIYIHRISKTL